MRDDHDLLSPFDLLDEDCGKKAPPVVAAGQLSMGWDFYKMDAAGLLDTLVSEA